MQEVRLIKKLMSICQSDEEEFKRSKQLDQFCKEFGVGQEYRSVWRISRTEKDKIANIIRNEAKADPDATVGQWDDAPRHRALEMGGNEKHTKRRLRDCRVAVKSLPGRPMMFGDGGLFIPPGACLDLDLHWVAEHCEHEEVLLVENWENFELTHQTPFLRGVPGNPLVIFRGAPGSYKISASHELLRALARPVLAFTDYDPEGVAIAATLPHFSRYLAPSTEVLERLMKQVTTHDRYVDQLAGKLGMLESLTDPELVRVFGVIRKATKALPQEKLIELEIEAQV
jgi:hypothetical protein